jgi:hypothetical protein
LVPTRFVNALSSKLSFIASQAELADAGELLALSRDHRTRRRWPRGRHLPGAGAKEVLEDTDVLATRPVTRPSRS